MSQIHIMQEGEHLSAVAARYDFGSFIPIWNAPENAKLRAVREDPHQLLPGDRVIIPDRRAAKPFVRKAGGSYKFVVYVEKLKLRLRVLDLDGNPAPGAVGKLTLGGAAACDVVADGDGAITAAIPRSCTAATLELGADTYDLCVGALNPISESTGVAARLRNVGCWYGEDDDNEDPDALQLAVELFQAAHDLDTTGEVTDDLVDQLDKMHDGRE